MLNKSKNYYEWADKRRSVRHFSNKEIPIEVIENIIKTASTAPSGANKQPWTFCVVKSRESALELELTSSYRRALFSLC